MSERERWSKRSNYFLVSWWDKVYNRQELRRSGDYLSALAVSRGVLESGSTDACSIWVLAENVSSDSFKADDLLIG